MNRFEFMEKETLQEINGGALAGAIIGFVFGTAGGVIAGMTSAVIAGNAEDAGHIILTTTLKGMTGGTLAGIASPI